MLILASSLLLLCLTRINGDILIEAGQNLNEDETSRKLNTNFKESVFGIENLEKLNTVLDSDFNFINAGPCVNEGESKSRFNAYFKESNGFGDDNHNIQNTAFTDDFALIKTGLGTDEEDESHSGLNADVEERGAIRNILTKSLKTDSSVLEDAALDTVALIKKYGYPCEIHRVNTEDGFMLEMHRVPYGRANNNTANRPVVFLQHGLLSSSGEWVLMRPGKGLAYLLADAGYDVWMGNARGNRYSRKHKRLRPTSASFWKFSWHEIGYYDIPAMIDYILKERGVKKLHYIGFSQGTTVFWVMTSMRPEYNEKIVAMQALAPIAYMSHARSPLIRALAPFTRSLHVIFRLLGANEFLPNGWINEVAGQTLCVEEAITQVLCTNLLFLICGFNSAQLNTTMVPIILGHTPAGASTRQLIHYGQLVNSGQFRRFDYGLISNMAHYGSAKPPAYDLEAITVPVFLHYSDNDWLATPRDVEKLRKRVKTVVGKFRVPLSAFNHLDFVFAIDAKKLIYDRVLNIMARFNDK